MLQASRPAASDSASHNPDMHAVGISECKLHIFEIKDNTDSVTVPMSLGARIILDLYS